MLHIFEAPDLFTTSESPVCFVFSMLLPCLRPDRLILFWRFYAGKDIGVWHQANGTTLRREGSSSDRMVRESRVRNHVPAEWFLNSVAESRFMVEWFLNWEVESRSSFNGALQGRVESRFRFNGALQEKAESRSWRMVPLKKTAESRSWVNAKTSKTPYVLRFAIFI